MSLTPRDGIALGAAALAAAALGAAGWLLLGSAPPAGTTPSAPPAISDSSFAALGSQAADATPLAALLVDVQGGVARPGIVRLPPGSRVADAIEAAGGYAKTADLLAAATAINLAAALSDGAQVFVPIEGLAAGPGPTDDGGGGTVGGLVNLNTATPEELDSLPGIGPVTVQKIVAARAERPFATLEELVERDVMHSGQLEDIRGLVAL